MKLVDIEPIISEIDRIYKEHYSNCQSQAVSDLYRAIHKKLKNSSKVMNINGCLVHLPCKPGDKVFGIIEDDENGNFIDEGIVISVSFQNHCWIYVRYNCGLTYDYTVEDIGTILFFDKEEANSFLQKGLLK